MVIAKSKEIAILAITVNGAEVGRRLKMRLTGSHLFLPEKLAVSGTEENFFRGSLKEPVSRAFNEYKYLVLIMATGIVVRLIAPLLKDKHSDPGVVVVDDAGTFAISLLSGHVGGANELARRVAAAIGAKPVITTASEAMGTIPADILGRKFGWEIEDNKYLTQVGTTLVNGEAVGIYQDAGEPISRLSVIESTSDSRSKLSPFSKGMGAGSENIHVFSSLEDLSHSHLKAALIITDRILGEDIISTLPQYTMFYRPKSLVVGIGCNRGTPGKLIEEAVDSVFTKFNLSTKCIKNLATIDIKKDEAGLLEFVRNRNLTIDFLDKKALGQTDYPSPASETVMKHVGTPTVCEAAALLSSRGTIIVPKVSFQRAVTIAVARLSSVMPKIPYRGKVYIIGTGPGQPEQITLRAREAIKESEVIVGYNTYVKLIEPLLQGQEVVATGMGAEIERVKTGLDLARQGRTVSIVSSGDAGVYGMAGLMGELLRENPDNGIEITVIPGVPALAASAALLGAPLTNDFACISLSDHLVPWETIRERLECAAKGDFVIVLYNPKSRQRAHLLAEARDIILRHRLPSTKTGIVTNAYREEQRVTITDLEHLLDCEVNMNSTVIVGNSTTFTVKEWMVTPRGYHQKYGV